MEVLNSYKLLKRKVIKRKEPFLDFIEFIENQTSWLKSPASTRYHLNHDGGLLEHSVGVTETLLKLREVIAPVLSEESCVIVGLFHDIGKVGMAGKPYYLYNDNEWERKNRDIKYKINNDLVSMGQGMRSLYLVSKYLPLSDTEAQAIAYHDGQYINDNKAISHREEPLTLLLHWADYWTAHIYEEGREVRNDEEYFDRDERYSTFIGAFIGR
jgi:hypothetical protein